MPHFATLLCPCAPSSEFQLHFHPISSPFSPVDVGICSPTQENSVTSVCVLAHGMYVMSLGKSKPSGNSARSEEAGPCREPMSMLSQLLKQLLRRVRTEQAFQCSSYHCVDCGLLQGKCLTDAEAWITTAPAPPLRHSSSRTEMGPVNSETQMGKHPF